MDIRGLIPGNFVELVKAVPIDRICVNSLSNTHARLSNGAIDLNFDLSVILVPYI